MVTRGTNSGIFLAVFVGVSIYVTLTVLWYLLRSAFSIGNPQFQIADLIITPASLVFAAIAFLVTLFTIPAGGKANKGGSIEKVGGKSR